jgi:Spy/CpxP family protein refolding chaperone
MNRKLSLVALLVIATPFVYAQDATQAPPSNSQNAPSPAQPAPSHREMNRDWGSRPPRDGDGERSRGMERDGGPDRGWAFGGRSEHGDDGLPFGMWWKNSQVAARVGLSADQQKRMDALVLQSRLQLIHLHATLQEEQLLLEPLLDASPFDQAKALEQINKIADTRADLEKTNAKMLLSIRGVLTADQWTKLRDHDHGMARPGGEWRDKRPDGPPRAN